MIGGFDMELINRFIGEYTKARKKRKTEILKQYSKLTGVSRQASIKRFLRYMVTNKNDGREIIVNKRGPKIKYGIIHKEIIKKCWELAGNVCAEKIHPMIKIYIEQLELNNKLSFYPKEVIEQVKDISLGTLKGIMVGFPRIRANRHKGNIDIYKQVPIIADFGKYARYRPGYTEVDYVEHNGGNSSGNFAITGVYVDLFSQWIARASGLGKNLGSVESIDKKAHQKIFHPIIHYHPDSEKSILKLLFDRMRNEKSKTSFHLSRSRPYKKNDNAHVEQKNGDKVRKLIGYFRYDSEEEVELLNQIYDRADLIDNFFIATAKLKKKIKNSKGKVIKKIYYKPQTPYQRLMTNKHIPLEIKLELEAIYRNLNMVKLKEEMDGILEKLYEIICEKNGQKPKRFQGQKLLSNKIRKKSFQGHLINI
jgi:hypothetical protein